MLYLGDHWFDHENGGVTAEYPQDEGLECRLRFWTDQLWSEVAHEHQQLHADVFPTWWHEAHLDAAGTTTTLGASYCLWRHFRYALEPGTMLFHHRRLVNVFTQAKSIPTLWHATPAWPTPGARPQSLVWQAQNKVCRTIRKIRRQHWLKALSIILLHGLNGLADVVRLILNDLERWALCDTSGFYTTARYFLEEAVEEALYATYSFDERRRLC